MKITFLDLETTGLDPVQNEIIELAAIQTEVTTDSIVVLESVEFKVKPTQPVDPYVANLNGYNEKDWEDAVSMETALNGIFHLMQGCLHAGSNPKFDESFLKNASKKCNIDYPKLASHHIIDVTTLSLHLFIEGKIQKLRQESIAEYYGIPGGGHRAMADSEQCMKIFAVEKTNWQYHYWNPMSTAPRDGTWVILRTPSDICIARWISERSRWELDVSGGLQDEAFDAWAMLPKEK